MENREKSVVVVAGGSGTRMGAALPKQFLVVAGKPVGKEGRGGKGGGGWDGEREKGRGTREERK